MWISGGLAEDYASARPAGAGAYRTEARLIRWRSCRARDAGGMSRISNRQQAIARRRREAPEIPLGDDVSG